MAIALSLEHIDFILECDRELQPEEQTVFKLAPLTSKQVLNLRDKIKFKGTEVVNQGTVVYLYATLGLVGWSNFKNSAGDDVPFGKNMDDNLKLVPLLYLMEMFTELDKLSNITDADSKN